jgi:hypothetical protein
MCDTRTMATRPKRPGDFAQLGKLVVDILTGERPNDSPKGSDIRLSTVRRKAATKGGKARAKALSPRKRKAIAKKAARARWGDS